MSCMSWNCKSLNIPKSAELSDFINTNNIKIAMLSETWLNSTKNINISNFVSHRVDRFHGGVAILIHKSIPHSLVKTISYDHSFRSCSY